MELLESLILNKKNFIILAVIYFVVVIAILVWIWWPDTVLEQAHYEPYDETSKNNEMLEYYVRFLDTLKLYSSEELFKSYIDSEYLLYNGITAGDAFSILKTIDKQYYIESYDVYKVGDKNIYSVMLPSGDEKIRVNIIEKNYPYDFYVTYGTFMGYSNLSYYGRIGSGADLNIVGTYKDINYIEYELLVSNEKYDNLTISLLNADNFSLELEDGTNISLNLLKSTQDIINVEKGQAEGMKLLFNVGVELQSKIVSLNIKNITNGDSKFTTKILL